MRFLALLVAFLAFFLVEVQAGNDVFNTSAFASKEEYLTARKKVLEQIEGVEYVWANLKANKAKREELQAAYNLRKDVVPKLFHIAASYLDEKEQLRSSCTNINTPCKIEAAGSTNLDSDYDATVIGRFAPDISKRFRALFMKGTANKEPSLVFDVNAYSDGPLFFPLDNKDKKCLEQLEVKKTRKATDGKVPPVYGILQRTAVAKSDADFDASAARNAETILKFAIAKYHNYLLQYREAVDGQLAGSCSPTQIRTNPQGCAVLQDEFTAINNVVLRANAPGFPFQALWTAGAQLYGELRTTLAAVIPNAPQNFVLAWNDIAGRMAAYENYTTEGYKALYSHGD